MTEVDLDPGQFESTRVVAQGIGELLLAGDAPRELELSADVGVGLEQFDVVTAFGGAKV